MKVRRHMKRVFAIFAIALSLGGCASMMSSAVTGLTDNLSAAILNQDDPELVRIGAPSYLLLLDSFVEGSPDNPDIPAAAATLYATSRALFAADAFRASTLNPRARRKPAPTGCDSLGIEPRSSSGLAASGLLFISTFNPDAIGIFDFQLFPTPYPPPRSTIRIVTSRV